LEKEVPKIFSRELHKERGGRLRSEHQRGVSETKKVGEEEKKKGPLPVSFPHRGGAEPRFRREAGVGAHKEKKQKGKTES